MWTKAVNVALVQIPVWQPGCLIVSMCRSARIRSPSTCGTLPSAKQFVCRLLSYLANNCARLTVRATVWKIVFYLYAECSVLVISLCDHTILLNLWTETTVCCCRKEKGFYLQLHWIAGEQCPAITNVPPATIYLCNLNQRPVYVAIKFTARAVDGYSLRLQTDLTFLMWNIWSWKSQTWGESSQGVQY